ncbi:uncharacterized protein LOC121804170 [Salvia splendens]|uniref:uncharacterized protein LOC121804170 n=1 Tax=Salvia splendens TaxID=180675 RepID=UPI001C27A78A|nr:uncharacterized protein LOC121804170 [Salvia splendens]
MNQHIYTGRKEHTLGTLPSLPEINPKGNCHAVQLRGGTTYQPPQAADLGRERKEKEQEPTDFTPAADQSQRPAASPRSGPPETPQLAEPDSDIDAEPSPAAATPLRSGLLPESQLPDPQFPSTATIPYPQRLKCKKLDAQFTKFLEAISKVHINIPLVEALQQMPNYVKFLKDVVAKKRKWGKYETVGLTENCSAIIQKGLATKHKDPRSFTLYCVLGNNVEGKALCDLGASINLMPLSFYMKLNIDNIRPTSITLQMVDRSTTTPRGIVEDVLVRVGEFICPADFVVLDMHETRRTRGSSRKNPSKGEQILAIGTPEEEEEMKKALGKPRGPPKVELKPLPEHLRSYWAKKKLNQDFQKVGKERHLFLNEMEEFRMEAYDSSFTYKERMKVYHDRMISPRELKLGDVVLLHNSRHSLFPGKLKSKWTGPYMIKKIYDSGTVELLAPDGTLFQVNGHRVQKY